MRFVKSSVRQEIADTAGQGLEKTADQGVEENIEVFVNPPSRGVKNRYGYR
jgi:hypothetical protein